MNDDTHIQIFMLVDNKSFVVEASIGHLVIFFGNIMQENGFDVVGIEAFVGVPLHARLYVGGSSISITYSSRFY